MSTEIKLVNGELSKIGINIGVLKTIGQLENEELDNYYENIKKTTSKPTISKSELIYYLEEMYQLDELTYVEEEIYENYQYGNEISKKEWLFVYNQMIKHYNEKF